jgi:hypothetical protein
MRLHARRALIQIDLFSGDCHPAGSTRASGKDDPA